MPVFTWTSNADQSVSTAIVNFRRTDGTQGTIRLNQPRDLTQDEINRLTARGLVLTEGGVVGGDPPPTSQVVEMTATVNTEGEYVPTRPVHGATGGGSGMANPMTAAGDMIYGGTSGAPTRLIKDSNGKFLGLEGGLPKWLLPPGFANPMTTEGDIIVADADGLPQRLAKGAIDTIIGVKSDGTLGYVPKPSGGSSSSTTTLTWPVPALLANEVWTSQVFAGQEPYIQDITLDASLPVASGIIAIESSVDGLSGWTSATSSGVVVSGVAAVTASAAVPYWRITYTNGGSDMTAGTTLTLVATKS